MSKETKYRTFTIADMAFDLRVSSRTIRRMIRKKVLHLAIKLKAKFAAIMRIFIIGKIIRRKNLEEITQDKEE